MDYISRDLLLQKLKSFYDESKPFTEYRVGYDDCICAIEDLISDMPALKQKEIRQDTANEFANKLKEIIQFTDDNYECWEIEGYIDDLVKEMTESR